MPLTANPKELRNAYPISPSYYIESNIDSNTKFRRLKILLTKFGYEDELLINFSSYEPEVVEAENIDRAYWEKKSDRVGMKIVDDCRHLLSKIDSGLNITYTVSYIGLSKGAKAKNFILFFPRQGFEWKIEI